MNARTPVAYGSVAVLCICLHNAVIIVADMLGLSLWLGVLISFGVVSVIGYLLHAIVTFRQSLALGRYLRYALAMSANVPLAFVTTWFVREVLGIGIVLAAPLASLCMLVFNFVLSRWAVLAPGARQAEAK